MSGLLNKFRKRNIQANLPHFILVIFVVAVSVCLITGLWISHLTFSSSVSGFYENSHLPNLWIETDKVTTEDEIFLSQYEYGKRYKFQSDFIIENQTYTSNFIVSNGEVSCPYLVEGTKGFGCYVDAKFIDKYQIGIYSSKIYFNYTVGGETKRLSFLVLGSFSLAEDMLVDEECMIFIDEEVFLKSLSDNFDLAEDFELDYNQVLITSEIEQENKVDIQKYYDGRDGGLSKLKTRDEIQSFRAIEREMNISETMIAVIPILFVVVSALVVVSAITELVLKERYNIGMLKSLGIKNVKILSNYCGYGVYMCLIGAIAGLIISPLIVPNISFETYDLLFNLPRDVVRMTIPYWLILSIILSVILIGYFSAFVVCIKFVLRTPKECMQGVKKFKSNQRKAKKRGGKIDSIVKNFKDNPARTIMSLFTISGCSLLILLGYGVGNINTIEQNQAKLSFQMFSGIFKGFAITILLLAIIITVVQILREKTREIALQRIHGESFIKVWINLMLEVFALGVIGFVVAGVLVQPVFIVLLRFFGISSIIFIDFLAFLKTFFMVFGFVSLSSIIAVIKIYKTNLVDATKFSE